ncbi:MAG: hypothetical protein J6K97_01265, partial [Clostridia bacterium]|nr:hypothetical protein [Clostridia bacterium]
MKLWLKQNLKALIIVFFSALILSGGIILLNNSNETPNKNIVQEEIVEDQETIAASSDVTIKLHFYVSKRSVDLYSSSNYWTYGHSSAPIWISNLNPTFTINTDTGKESSISNITGVSGWGMSGGNYAYKSWTAQFNEGTMTNTSGTIKFTFTSSNIGWNIDGYKLGRYMTTSFSPNLDATYLSAFPSSLSASATISSGAVINCYVYLKPTQITLRFNPNGGQLYKNEISQHPAFNVGDTLSNNASGRSGWGYYWFYTTSMYPGDPHVQTRTSVTLEAGVDYVLGATIQGYSDGNYDSMTIISGKHFHMYYAIGGAFTESQVVAFGTGETTISGSKIPTTGAYYLRIDLDYLSYLEPPSVFAGQYNYVIMTFWIAKKSSLTSSAITYTIPETQTGYNIYPNPTRAGYTFAGWKDSAGNITAEANPDMNQTETFTAQWTANTY